MSQAWQFGLVGILAVALVTDLKARKIYNWLTFPGLAAGLALSTGLGGLAGLQGSLGGLLAASAVFLLLFLLPQSSMGAGDVKLMAVVGAWLGWPAALAAVVYVSFAGGVVALAQAARYGTLKLLFRNVYWIFVGLLVPGGKASGAVTRSATPPVPYGVAIVAGACLALLYPEPQHLFDLVRR
ncbi:MAG: A24 family peptidase [Candidatus Sericytochromatia bacterium]|nr:A24 family peptidase [Candidatus Sericytochromatia bacterium]